MKVLLVGSFRGSPTEGLRNVSQQLSDALADQIDTKTVHTRELLLPATFRKIKDFCPDVIHYLAGPTSKSLLGLLPYRIIFQDSRVVLSATRPVLRLWDIVSLAVLSPDLILTQDPRWERMFHRLNVSCRQFPNGVDSDRFRPVPNGDQSNIRRRLGIAEDSPLLLHVGHIRRSRNLLLMVSVARQYGLSCLIVGSPTLSDDKRLLEALLSKGAGVVTEQITNIEAYYASADVYVFPVVHNPTLLGWGTKQGSIDFPLSVLESLACGTPVVSTEMPALVSELGGADGLFWFDGTEPGLGRALGEAMSSKTRPDAELIRESYGWNNLAGRLVGIYASLIR